MDMKRNLKTLEIAETVADPKTKLQARAIANDCFKYIMDLTTNGIIVTDAIKYVQTKTDHLNASEKKPLHDTEQGHKEGKEAERLPSDLEEKTKTKYASL
jgi:hypothetical protein